MIINSILFLIKNNRNILGCGLTGFVSNDGKEANFIYLQLIASYNATRGTDACGVYISQTVEGGINADADIRNFLVKYPLRYNNKVKDKNVMIHARKSSWGAKSLENCHPFEIVNNDTKKTLYLQHNGTLTNSWELSRLFKVEHNNLKVDSRLLAEIINSPVGYDVLEKYIGTAALMMMYKNEPNTMYVFRGKSKTYTNGVEEEERPLFALVLPEGVYLSSMKEPLDLIHRMHPETTVLNLKTNIVVKIQKNQLTIIREIDRSKIHVPTSNIIHYNSATTDAEADDDELRYLQWYDQNPPKKSVNTTNSHVKTNTVEGGVVKHSMLSSNFQMYNERLYLGDVNAFRGNDIIVFIAGRYYHFIPTKGIEYNEALSDNITVGSNVSQFALVNGYFEMLPHPCGAFYTGKFSESAKKSVYFYEGVLINDTMVDRFIKKSKNRFDKMTNREEVLRQLSTYATHPILNSLIEMTQIKEKNKNYTPTWYFKGSELSLDHSFSPRFGQRVYIIERGSIRKIGVKSIKEVALSTDILTTALKKTNLIDVPLKPKQTELFPNKKPLTRTLYTITNKLFEEDVVISRVSFVNNAEIENSFHIQELKNFFASNLEYTISIDDFYLTLPGKNLIDETIEVIFNHARQTMFTDFTLFLKEINYEVQHKGIRAWIKEKLGIDPTIFLSEIINEMVRTEFENLDSIEV